MTRLRIAANRHASRVSTIAVRIAWGIWAVRLITIRDARRNAETLRMTVGMLIELNVPAYRFSLMRVSFPTFSRR